jgi:hypothetical protein
MRIGAPSPTRGATHQEGVHVARPSLRALSRPFLSDEQYGAIRQNTYMALQQRRNPRAVAEGTRAGNIFLTSELQWLLQRDAEWLAESARQAACGIWTHVPNCEVSVATTSSEYEAEALQAVR